jgi:hypothetical protein
MSSRSARVKDEKEGGKQTNVSQCVPPEHDYRRERHIGTPKDMRRSVFSSRYMSSPMR